MKRIMGIAFIAVRNAVRSRVVLSLVLLILAILIIFPLTVEGDGTVTGQVNITLRYTLTAVTFLLGLVTVWMGCASISVEVQQRQIHLLTTKPVKPLELWLGKWIGLLIVNTGILTFTSILLLACMAWTFRSDQFESSGNRDILAEIWRARSPVAPTLEGIDAQVKDMVDQRMPSLEAASSPPPRLEVEKAARDTLLTQMNSVPSQATRTWAFSPPDPITQNIPLRLSYRISASSIGPVNIAGQWSISQEGSGNLFTQSVTNNSGREYSILIPSSGIQQTLPLLVRFENLSQDNSTVILAPRDFRLHLYRHSLATNLAKAMLLIFFELAFLGAVGVSAGALVSLPVAALTCGYIVLLLQAEGYITRLATSGDLVAGNDGVLESIMQVLFSGLNILLLPLKDRPILDWLAEGVWIDPGILLFDGFIKLVVYSGAMALIGSALFKRREIGLPA